MASSNSETARPAALVGPRSAEARERLNPRQSPVRGTDRSDQRRAVLPRLVRPFRHDPPRFQVEGDVVHRFRALALVSPAGNVYFGDDEARYTEFAQRCARARAATHSNMDDCVLFSDRQMLINAITANDHYRASWRHADLRRLHPRISLPPESRQDGGILRRPRRHHRLRGRGSRRRNNARRNQRRARARSRRLQRLVDLSFEPDMAQFDGVPDSEESWG